MNKPTNLVVNTAKKPPRAGMGRPRGAKNKTTRTAIDAISIAAEKLGGAERLVEWAKEDPANEKVFWGTIYPKLLPLQVTGSNGGPVSAHLTIEYVKPNHPAS